MAVFLKLDFLDCISAFYQHAHTSAAPCVFSNTVLFLVLHNSNKCCKQSSLLEGFYCQASNYGMLISQEFDMQEKLCLCHVGPYIIKIIPVWSGAVLLVL